MGGTGSVLQHDEKTTYSKAEETGLLRLYNRKHREKKGLSGKLGAVGIKIEQFEICAGSPTMEVCLGSVGMDSGKDKPLLSLPAQTSGYRDYCPSKVAGLLQISEFSLCSESSPRRSVSIAKGVAERKQRRREKRVRARENVMIQMYNNNRHSGLDSSLARLRCSFQRCSIKGGSWATASAVSAALREVGVTAGDQAIRALANQDYHPEERRLQSAKTTRPNNATPAAAAEEEDLRLVHWPSILAFLEDPYSHTPRENSAVSNLTSRGRGTSPRRENENTDEIRDVPDTGTVTTEMCGRHQDGREDTPHGERGEEIDQQQQLGCARGAFVENGADAVRGDPVDVRDLVNAACMAAKKGDASAIKDLANRLDLRRDDAFGRNPLYYACLCGHVDVADLVVIRAYGGVEKIPENERWECRKNALSEEIRTYLDTGIFSESSRPESCEQRLRVAAQSPAAGGSGCGRTSSASRCSSGLMGAQGSINYQEGGSGEAPPSGVRYTPPAQAVGGGGCGVTSNGLGSSRGFMEPQQGANLQEGVDIEGSASGVQHISPADEALSIASLFDSERGQEENGDY